jgi:hypothetical protein
MAIRARSARGVFVAVSGEALRHKIQVKVSDSVRDRLVSAAPDPLVRADWLRSAIAEKLERENSSQAKT